MENPIELPRQMKRHMKREAERVSLDASDLSCAPRPSSPRLPNAGDCFWRRHAKTMVHLSVHGEKGKTHERIYENEYRQVYILGFR